MARQQQNTYDSDKEKRNLAKARTAELNSRTNQREDNSYFRSKGFPDRPTMTEAENSSEKRATNDRLTKNAETNSTIEALKAMAVAGGAGSPHSNAALEKLAQIAGVKVPKTVDPNKAKFDKVRASKGLPPLSDEEAPQPTQPQQQQPPQQDQSLFQPQAYGSDSGLVQQPETPREASLGNPITPHLGTGGAEITPENPTGDPRNSFGAGGLLDNPTHAAAQNVNAREMAAHPYGSDSRANSSQTYFPGEAVDRLAGGSQPKLPANVLPPKPAPVAAGGSTLVSNPAAQVPAPAPFQFDANKLVQPTPAAPTSNFSVQGGFAPGMNPIEALHGAIKQSVQAELIADQERRKRMTTPGVSVF